MRVYTHCNFLHQFQVIRFFGASEVTIYLYKLDAETHWDALVPSEFLPHPDEAIHLGFTPTFVKISSSSGGEGAGEWSRSPTLPKCTLTPCLQTSAALLGLMLQLLTRCWVYTPHHPV